jgi:hypothetical protein
MLPIDLWHNPASLVHLIAYLATFAALGYAAVSLVAGRAARSWVEIAGLSFAAGTAVTALVLMLASLAGHAPSRAVLAAVAALAVIVAVLALWRHGRLVELSVPTPIRRLDPTGIVGLAAAVVIAAAATNVWAAASRAPVGDIDEYATWMFKARVLSAEPLRPIPAALTAPGLSYSHEDYPLLFPLIVAGAYAAVGRPDVMAGKALLAPLYLSLIAVVYGTVRRDHRRAVALAVTAVTVAVPAITLRAGVAVAELPVTLFFACTASMLARWVQRQERGDLLLAGGFAAAAAFTKNEGLAMLPVFACAALGFAASRPATVRRQALLTWALAVTVTIVAAGPWLIYRLWLPKTHEDYGGKFTSLPALRHGLGRLPDVLIRVGGFMLDANAVGGAWIVLALAAIVGRRAWGTAPARVMWAVLVGQVGLYVAAFLVTPWDPAVLVPMVTTKLLAQAAPVVAVLIGLHLSAAGFGPGEVKWSPPRADVGR